MIEHDLLTLRPAGGFEMLFCDPPWHLKCGVNQKHAAFKYSTMETQHIADLPVGAVAAHNSLLWLWVTRPFLEQAFGVIAAWGFKYKTCGHWTKWNPETGKLAFGTGYLLRDAGEPFLIATRGRVRTTRSVRSVIMAPRRQHSRKPDEAYEAAEELMPDARRLDLFSRQTRPGWTAWGLEAGMLDEERGAA